MKVSNMKRSVFRPFSPQRRHGATLALAAATAVATVVPNLARAADFYFDSSWAGGGNGTSSNPWNSLSFANSRDFGPGDNLYLRGTFNSGLTLDSNDSGTKAQPVTIQPWGTNNRPVINAGLGFGIKAMDVGGIKIQKLDIVGSGPADVDSDGLYNNKNNGILFQTGSGKKNYVEVNDVWVHGFGENGISLRGTSGTSGYDDVKISNVLAFQNQRAGVSMEGDYNNANKAAHTNVLIDHVRAYQNTGRPNSPARDEGNSGNGIVIGQVDGGVIQYSVAHDNGTACDSQKGGPVGIWAWDSNNVKIQFNESFQNGTGGGHDGGGFDLDGGVSNSVMQYNYSHDNDGAGFLVCQFENARPFTGNVVRFNISQNDGRRNGYGGIHSFGKVGTAGEVGADIYNNTVFMGPQQKPTQQEITDQHRRNESSAAIKFRSGDLKKLRFFNNLIVINSDGSATQFDPKVFDNSGGASGFSFLNNAYWDLSGSTTGIGSDPSKILFDPQLLAAGLGTTLDNADQLASLYHYMLADESPMIDVGVDLSAYGIVDGGRDFYGNGMHGSTWDIGAAENLSRTAQAPEPAGLALTACAAMGLLRRRRRP
jgi:hypothetical protein